MFNKGTLSAVLLSAILGGSAAANAAEGDGHRKFDPAKADQHISMMVGHILEQGTPQQKAQLTEIATSCYRDVAQLKQQLNAGYGAMGKTLAQPTVDQAALEAQRIEQVRKMDLLSRRVTQAALDAAAILSVEQRRMFNHGLHVMALSQMHGH